jgi:D-isomer specific 2-hydroxyacid dehydrogenase, NAD binding domain
MDSLVGTSLAAAGVIGTGWIGQVVSTIVRGFGMEVIAHDPFPSAVITGFGIPCVPIRELFARRDVITLHCPLTPETTSSTPSLRGDGAADQRSSTPRAVRSWTRSPSSTD